MQSETNSKTYKHTITCNGSKNKKKTKFNDQITENRKSQGHKKMAMHGEVIMQMFLHE